MDHFQDGVAVAGEALVLGVPNILDSPAPIISNPPEPQPETHPVTQPPAPTPRDRVRATVPKLIELTDDVLFGDIWERPELSKRDRSLITIAVLTATYRPEQLKGHLQRALDNGLTRTEISEMITHVAFYAGWPAAMSAANIARDIFEANP